MKNYKKYYFLALLTIEFSLFLVSCQDSLTINSDLEKSSFDSIHTAKYIDFDKSQVLTPLQLSGVFPESLNGLSRTSIKLDQQEGSATAFYGDHQYEISIIDDLRTDFSNMYLFNKKHNSLDQVEKGEKRIRTVRDGYRTITTIQEDIGVTSISFVYKKRYLFTITGTNKQTPYMVWRFLELHKFHKLPE